MDRQLPLPLTLSDEARFSNFYIPDIPASADSSQSHNSSRAEVMQLLMARGSPSKLSQSGSNLELDFAVYLWGPSGGGKTHLAQACCRWYIEAGQRAMYLTLDELIDYPPGEVLADLEHNDVLCIDGIDAISAYPQWQTALFDLYNRARESGCRLVLVGRDSPGNLNMALADLKSRLAAATGFALSAYTDEERAAILLFRAERLGLSLSQEVASFLLSRLPRETSALMECLHHLDREALAGQRRLTVPFVKTALQL